MFDLRIFEKGETEKPIEGLRLASVVALGAAGPASLLVATPPASVIGLSVLLGAIAGLLLIPRVRILSTIGLLLFVFGLERLVDRIPDIAQRQQLHAVLLAGSAMIATAFLPRVLRRLIAGKPKARVGA
jgi:hypothetical protein